MSLESQDIAKIAHLARLRVDDRRIPELAQQMSSILEMVEQMNAAETDGLRPMAHPGDAVASLRPDVVTETDQRKQFQAIAPAVEDGLYLVPKVIE